MMRAPRSLIVALSLALLGLSWCKKESPPADEGRGPGKGPARASRVPKLGPEERKVVLAEVNGEKVTKGEFHDKIHRQSVFNRRRYTKLERKKQYLEREFIMPILEYAEAQKRGLDKDPYVLRTLNNLMVSKLMRQLRTEFKTGEPTDAELKAFYEKHQDDYNQPELVRVSHILVKDKALAEKLATEAKGKSRVDFRRLVQKHSVDDVTKARSGDLRYFDRQGKVRGLPGAKLGSVPKPIVDAAWSLKKPGDVAGPIKTGAGWHVIYYTGRRPARVRNFGQARMHVKKRVMREKWQDKKQEFIEKLKKEFRVGLPEGAKLNQLLGLVKIDLSAPPPQQGHHHGHGRRHPLPGVRHGQ